MYNHVGALLDRCRDLQRLNFNIWNILFICTCRFESSTNCNKSGYFLQSLTKMQHSKAVVCTAFGGYDVLSIQDYPLEAADGKIEVEVHYCGINFADIYIRQGLIPTQQLPFVLGIECTGIVSNTFSTNTTLKPGDHVICYDYTGGLFREKILINTNKCYLLPNDITLEQGACLFVNYLTAYFALFHLGNLKTNECVLIPSCGGGVGWAMTQLAKQIKGVKVVGLTSKSKEEAVKLNGVDVVIDWDDYENQLISGGHAFDLIIDNEGKNKFIFLQTTLKPLGRMVAIGANSLIQNEKKIPFWTMLMTWWWTKDISRLSLITNNHMMGGLHLGVLADREPEKIADGLVEIFRMFREGSIKLKIDSIWPLDQVENATKVLATRKNVGKVLLAVNSS